MTIEVRGSWSHCSLLSVLQSCMLGWCLFCALWNSGWNKMTERSRGQLMIVINISTQSSYLSAYLCFVHAIWIECVCTFIFKFKTIKNETDVSSFFFSSTIMLVQVSWSEIVLIFVCSKRAVKLSLVIKNNLDNPDCLDTPEPCRSWSRKIIIL